MKAEVLALSKPDLGRWLLLAAGDWAIVALALAVARTWNHPLGYFLAVLVVGTRQHALSFLGHDGAHFRLSRHRWLNDGLTGLLCSWPMGVGLDGYRKFHFLHHKTVGTAGDPELAQRRWAKPQWDLPKRWPQVRGYLLRDFLGFAVSDLYCFTKVMKPVSRSDRLGPLLWWSAAATLFWFTGTGWIAAIWWTSTLTAYWAVFRLRMWCEHIGTDGTHRVSATWWQRALYQPHNAWCHYEHHRHPAVPCWNLPTVRRLDRSVPVQSIASLWGYFAIAERLPLGAPQLRAPRAESVRTVRASQSLREVPGPIA